MQPETDAQRRRTLLIAGGVVIMLIIIGALLTLSNKPKPTTDTTGNGAISTTKNNTDSNVAVNEKDLTTEAGTDFSPIIDLGVKSSYIDGLQAALLQYAQPKNISVRNTTVVKGSAVHNLPETGKAGAYHSFDFTVKFDANNSVKAQLRALSTYRMQVILYDPTSKAQVFDSGVIDTRNI